MDIEHIYHMARNLYAKPRVCKDCNKLICNYPIPVNRNYVNKPDEPNIDYDIQIYHCTLTLGHYGSHGNKRIREQMRFQW